MPNPSGFCFYPNTTTQLFKSRIFLVTTAPLSIKKKIIRVSKTEPVTVGADATVEICLVHKQKLDMSMHPLRL